MTSLERRLILRELNRRKGLKVGSGSIRDRILNSLFDKQRAFVLDPAREKSALCPRRAGKTKSVPAHFYWTLLGLPPNRIARYWAITQDRAQELMWLPLLRAAAEYGINIVPEKTMLTVRLPNGSEIRLEGADKAKEAEKKRGEASVLDILDECSLYGPYLKALVEDVITPTHMDFQGTTCMMGTPGILWRGYWFEVSGPDEEKRAKGWSRHGWDVYDNPHMPDIRAEIERIRLQRGWGFDHPTYLREYRGRWVRDTGALFYSFNPDLNVYDGTLPPLPKGEQWSHSLGWDIGANDAMALTLWAFHEDYPHLYERYSWKRSHARIDEVAERVRRLREEHGHFVHMVADTGGGGKVTVEEMASRHQLYFEAAKKTDKRGIVRFLNDDLTAGNIKVMAGSPLALEYETLTKDPEDETQEDPRCENHCADSALYGYRRAKHYQFEAKADTPPVGTKEHFDNIAKQMERRELDRLDEAQGREWWED